VSLKQAWHNNARRTLTFGLIDLHLWQRPAINALLFRFGGAKLPSSMSHIKNRKSVSEKKLYFNALPNTNIEAFWEESLKFQSEYLLTFLSVSS
jgi:hypothetical protein